MVLALYDFRSKQEYIYNTSKIKEISGASMILSEIFKELADKLIEEKISFVYDLKKPFEINKFSSDAAVLYDGGGNLMVIFKDEKKYIESNRIISKYLIEKYRTLSLIASHVEVTGNFEQDIKKLYNENRINKNRYPASRVTGVTPVTQIDPMTFMPVTYKSSSGEYYVGEVSLSEDRLAKVKKYKTKATKVKGSDELEELDNNGTTAVIYIDGNSMGQKLKSLSGSDYDEGVANLREFSEKIQVAFVDNPIKEIKKSGIAFRQIIGGGDEITLICKAENALEIIRIYFESLINSECVLPESCKEKFLSGNKKEALNNTACAGIAVVHAKTPFNIAYDLAEAACESAKEKAHKTPENYFDFYYCHAGATASFEVLRNKEQSITGRPYAYSDIAEKFEKYKPMLQKAGRANVKALGSAAQRSFTDYKFEVSRINAYLKEAGFSANEDEMKLIYDMSEFYDLWFNKKKEEEE